MDEQIFDDSCETIKNIKRNEVMEKLFDYPLPKYFVTSVEEIVKILDGKK